MIRLLTGRTISTEQDAIECMELLHKKGAKVVVISSSLLGTENELIAFGSSSNVYLLYCLVVKL